ncbi:MarR family winged helix-turn-helix transcriptional regulator [Rhodococcoides fascians]|uniref:MarR family winged helix-turn-helix transcriptional regulator n=1 Tax=Rhodococcoides fascians TaxID=1828 RepID=UPI00050CEBB3|nr:MarR family transcriptional regulator [Rhodococcus fascians]
MVIDNRPRRSAGSQAAHEGPLIPQTEPSGIHTSTEFEITANVLRLASSLRVRLTEVLGPTGLTWAQYEVLAQLSGRGPLSYRELGHDLYRHRTSIKATVSKLHSANYVERYTDWRNRQRQMVELTDAGSAAVVAAARVLDRSRGSFAVTDAESALEVLGRMDRSWTRKMS